MKYKILIIEDDDVIKNEIIEAFCSWGYEARGIEKFNEVMREFADFSPHLVLMDISLPYYNGHYWCGEIRKLSKVPIVFLSSANDNMNIVMAMNMGGDDFISKPFDKNVLLAKVQAMMRRTYDFQGQSSFLEYRGLILNLSNASLESAGRKIELTKNEFRMLQMLFEHKGKIVSREDLMKQLWDNDCFVDDNTLAVNMTRLRKKLEEYEIIDLITTKKGIGYCLVEGD